MSFLQRFHRAIYVFGALLAVTGIKLFLQRNQEMHRENNPLVRWFQKIVPMTPAFHGDKFMVLQNGRRYGTPLLLALVAVEATDLIFAVASIPAIAISWSPSQADQNWMSGDSNALRSSACALPGAV